MNTNNCFKLLVLLPLFSAVLCNSCKQQLVKPAALPANIPAIADSTEIENLVKEAFQVYQHGRLGESAKKLEDATSKITKYTPKSTVTTLFTFLAFFQKKSGDSDKAVATFKLVKGFFQELKTMPNESEALANKLIQFASQLSAQDRLQLLERLHPIASASHGKAGEAGVTWQIAEAYFELRAFEEAIQHASRAVEIYNQLGKRIQEARNLRIVGQSLAELNKVDEALQVLQKATDIQVEEKNLDEASKTYWWAIGFLKRLGRIKDVKQSLLTALDANDRIFRDKKVGAQIRSELAKVYRELGFFSEALKQFDIALTLHKELSDRKSEVLTLLEIADTFANLKDYDNRIGALILAEQLGTKLNYQNLQALILVSFAEAFRDYGDTVEALQKYLEAIEISHRASKENEIFPLIAISEFYMDWMNEYTKALHYLDKALTLAKEIGDRESEGNILLSIGRTYSIMGQYEDAIRLSWEALEILRATKAEKIYEHIALNQLGLAMTAQGQYEAALKIQQEYLQLALESGNPSHIQEAYSGLGYTSLQIGKYVEAIEAYKNAINWAESLRSWVVGEKHKIGFFEKQLVPYEGIIEALYHLYITGGPEKHRFAEEALYFAELSKARSWPEQLSVARLRFVEETIPQEVRKKEEDAISQFLAAEKVYTSASSRYRIPDEDLQKEEKAWEVAQKKWESFVEELYKQYPEYVTLRHPLTRIRYPADSFRKMAIRKGETLIVYKLTPDLAYAWVLSKIGGRNEILRFIRLHGKTKDIERLVEKFLTPFRKVKYEQFSPRVAAELFKTILQPVIKGLKSSGHLVIVPDGILSGFPFEALVTEMAGGNEGPQTPRFLFDRFNISYYPSTAILTINRQTVPKKLPPKGTILAVGDPVYGPGDERLAPSQVSSLRESDQRQGLLPLL